MVRFSMLAFDSAADLWKTVLFGLTNSTIWLLSFCPVLYLLGFIIHKLTSCRMTLSNTASEYTDFEIILNFLNFPKFSLKLHLLCKGVI